MARAMTASQLRARSPPSGPWTARGSAGHEPAGLLARARGQDDRIRAVLPAEVGAELTALSWLWIDGSDALPEMSPGPSAVTWRRAPPRSPPPRPRTAQGRRPPQPRPHLPRRRALRPLRRRPPPRGRAGQRRLAPRERSRGNAGRHPGGRSRRNTGRAPGGARSRRSAGRAACCRPRGAAAVVRCPGCGPARAAHRGATGLHRQGGADDHRCRWGGAAPGPVPPPGLPRPAARAPAARHHLRVSRLPPGQAPRRPPHHAVVRGRAHRPRRPRPAVPAPSRDGPRGPPAARARPFAQRPAPAPLPGARPRGTAGRGPLARHARTSAVRPRHGDGEGGSPGERGTLAGPQSAGIRRSRRGPRGIAATTGGRFRLADWVDALLESVLDPRPEATC